MSPLAHSVVFAVFGASLVWTPNTQKSVPPEAVQESTSQRVFGDTPAWRLLSQVVSRLPAPLYPDNVDCRDYDKTSYKIWSLRNKAPIDLGNWDGSFSIDSPIRPRGFVRNGIDLYDVLERKCGISVSNRGERAAEYLVTYIPQNST